MADIIPFKAVRTTKDKVSLVTSRSYEEYSASELAWHLDYNPLSFLHILHPAYSNQQSEELEKRFTTVGKKYHDFKDEKILVRDEKPSFYVHRIATNNNVFTGIVAGTSIGDYKTDVIKKHEHTLSYRVDFFKNFMKYGGFNTEPVLIAYQDNQEIENWISKTTSREPDFEFSTTLKEVHCLWKIDGEEAVAELCSIFDKIPGLYIADGHHRSASSVKLFDEIGGANNLESSYFMSFLIAESNVKIYEYNRLIKDLNQLSEEQFLEKLSENFFVQACSRNDVYPKVKHSYGMYLNNEYYSLRLKINISDSANILDDLDTQILYNMILNPVLGIGDLSRDQRISYIPGKNSVSELKSKVDNNEYAVGFLLFPVSVEEIKAVADAHLIMPPKSTYIEPKMRSGLLIYEIPMPDADH